MKKDRKVIATGHQPKRHTIIFADKRNKRNKRERQWKNDY